MFISHQEKKSINDKFKEYGETIAKLSIDIVVLTAKIKAIEGTKPVAAKRVKKKMTAEQRAKQRQYQKAYNERVKAKALAAKNLTKEENVSS